MIDFPAPAGLFVCWYNFIYRYKIGGYFGCTSQSREKFEDYEGFVEKFKPKRTTDDCYTPPEVYEVIKDWACEEYGIDPVKIVRPFYPGGDYESFDYSGGKVVVDNPPFSILSKIQEFYLDRGIPFFLFAPSLTCLTGVNVCMRTTHVICDCDIEYENGAVVRMSFVTNMGGDVVAKTSPCLTSKVNDIVKKIHKEKVADIPKYEYPDNVVTAAIMQRWAKYGVDFEVRSSECKRISKLDMQAEKGKAIFGGGLLLSREASIRRNSAERAAIERAATEQNKKHVWELSEREMRVVETLG